MTRASPLLVSAHAVAAAVVVAGVVAQVVRPLAPDPGPPMAAAQFFDEAFLRRVDAYRTPVELAGLFGLVVRLLIAGAAAFSPFGRRVAARVVARVGTRRPALAAAALIGGLVVVTDLVLLPLNWWIGFVHDGRYGLRTAGTATWLRDWAAAHAPVWLGLVVLAAAGYALARRLPRSWPAVAGLSAALLSAGVAFAAPIVLEPLQLRLEPLPESRRPPQLEGVLAAAGMQDVPLLVADASARTNRENAYVSGIGATRQIVLYDTLLDRRRPDEVAVVLAHEVAHRRNGDLWRGALFSAAGAVISAYVVFLVLGRRVRSGRQEGVADPRGALVAFAVVLALVVASLPVQQLVSRRAEAAADSGALQLTGAPETALRMQAGLTRANLSRPRAPGWVRVLWSSHPDPMERLTRASRWGGGA